MNESILKRVEILVQQSRWQEAKKELETLLEQDPTNFQGRYHYVIILLESGDKTKARELCDLLLEEAPDAIDVIYLSAGVELADEKYIAAESKAELIISMVPEASLGYEVLARANVGKRNYDRAFNAVEKALELDPENLDALNLKIHLSGYLGKSDTNDAIADALHINPNDASTIANQGFQLLREGKTQEALERLREALSMDPNNQLARYAMKEALKSRFLPYRWFFKYKELMGRLSAKGSWTFIIGAYLGYRALIYISKNNPALAPILEPIIYALLASFVLTWVIDPLINLYLLTIPYGRLLLDSKEKKMAQYTGMAFASMLVFGLLYFLKGNMTFGVAAMMSLGLMIPLGTFLRPVKKSSAQTLLYFTLGLVTSALIAIVLDIGWFVAVFFLGLFAYQWVYNGLMIKDNSRIFEDDNGSVGRQFD